MFSILDAETGDLTTWTTDYHQRIWDYNNTTATCILQVNCEKSWPRKILETEGFSTLHPEHNSEPLNCTVL